MGGCCRKVAHYIKVFKAMLVVTNTEFIYMYNMIGICLLSSIQNCNGVVYLSQITIFTLFTVYYLVVNAKIFGTECSLIFPSQTKQHYPVTPSSSYIQTE